MGLFSTGSSTKRSSRQSFPSPVNTRLTNNIRSPTWWLSLVLLLLSAAVGFQCGLVVLCNIKQHFTETFARGNAHGNTSHVSPIYLPPVSQEKQLILIAVMTSKDFLTTRAPAVIRTWAKKIPGEVIFFSSEGSTTNDSRIKLVSLPSVTDAYPPQKKSFLMMKYIYDHFIDKFEWFMRVDDDVYIRTDNLEKFLRSIDNRKPYYIGQTGMGTPSELGKIGLAPDENFCMGGPGIIIARETLARFTPHIKKCLKSFRSYHEDVELGRCVHRFANTSCTWSYEMQHILYNHPNKTTGYMAANLVSTDILRAASLHSIKDTRVFTRLHNFALQRRILDLEQRTMLLRRQIELFDKILRIGTQIKSQAKNFSQLIQRTKNVQKQGRMKQFYRLLNSPNELIAEQMMGFYNRTYRLFLNEHHHQDATDRQLWEALQNYFDRSSSLVNEFKYALPSSPLRKASMDRSRNTTLLQGSIEPGIYTLFTGSQYAANAELPVRSIEPAYSQCFSEVVRSYMESVNQLSRHLGRFLEYKKTMYGYYKYEPRHGMNYILDLFLMYRKYAGKKMSLPVRKRVYVVQKFRPLYFRERVSSSSSAILSSAAAASLDPPVIGESNVTLIVPSPIHVVVPVSGRLATLKRLLTNFDQVVVRSTEPELSNIHLYIILMETAEDSGERMSTIVDYVKTFLRSRRATRIHLIEVANSNFTRGYARSYGASRFNDTDLLFFLDLDMVFTRELFSRIRLHTIFHRQVYFPIIFSQYDPFYWETKDNRTGFSSFHLRDDVGYWRQYGFGMLGIYKADLGKIGDWNVNISGWGKEDVEIYDKLVQSPTLNVFRAVDNSLMHIFHTKECSPTLRDDQLKMCRGTKSITLGSQRILVERVLQMISIDKI